MELSGMLVAEMPGRIGTGLSSIGATGLPSLPAESGFAALTGVDEVDRLLNSRNFFGFLVRNLGFEFFFESHYQFNGIQRVGTKVIDERSIVGDFFFLDTQLLGNDAFYLFLRYCSL